MYRQPNSTTLIGGPSRGRSETMSDLMLLSSAHQLCVLLTSLVILYSGLPFMFTLKNHFPISPQKVRSCSEHFLMTLGTHAVWFGANFMGQQKKFSHTTVMLQLDIYACTRAYAHAQGRRR